MRKLFTLLLIFIVLQLQAKDYHLITFSSSSATLNNIKVENLTQGTSVGLDATDVLHLMIKTSGIGEVDAVQNSLKIFPNPMNHSCNIEFGNTQQGDVRFVLYDLSGKAIHIYHKELVKGIHTFNISGVAAGTYIVSVSTTADKFIAKLFVLEQINTAGSLEYVGQRNDPIFERDEINSQTLKLNESGTRAVVEMDYYSGDKLRFIGFNSINVSDTITASPLSDTALVFSFLRFFPAVNTASISNITASAARCGGNVIKDGGLAVTARGVVWSTKPNPTIDNDTTINGSGNGSFTALMTGLTHNTTYYVRAYATNSSGTSYGEQKSFVTQNGIISLITYYANSIKTYSTISGGDIKDNGGDTVIERGVCWSTSSNPTIADSITTDGSGSGIFTSYLTGLSYNTTYYIRAYATNSIGTFFGNELSFTTRNGVATLTTNSITDILLYSAQSGGYVSDDGGDPITSRGICWSTKTSPTIADSTTYDGSGLGTFVSNLTSLSLGTKYYVRAYATNSVGTSYGNQKYFTTLDGYPKITTYQASGLQDTAASVQIIIGNDGGAAITVRGICWSTSPNPSLSDSVMVKGSGTGSYVCNINGLSPGTTYYYKAFCTNSFGTHYGSEFTFTTTKPGDVYTKAGRVWMDRNLGATQVATSMWNTLAYGDLYQWGRRPDGHEKRTSGKYSGTSSTDTPVHNKFLYGSQDWRHPKNDSLWQGLNGINNPCPSGYRLPTADEWDEERKTWSSSDSYGAYASKLKLTVAGNRGTNGTITNEDLWGYYWSSTVDGTYAKAMIFDINSAYLSSRYRGSGVSVRCIRDY